MPNLERAAGAGYPGQFLIKAAVEIATHLGLSFLCLSPSSPYEALIKSGEALASRRQQPLRCVSRSGPVAGRAAHRTVRPSMVRHRIPRRDFHRLLVLALL